MYHSFRFPFLTLLLAIFFSSVAATAASDPAALSTELLKKLVAADTTNPPGNESRGVRIVAERLKSAGIQASVIPFAPGRENLVARINSSSSKKSQKKPLLLLAHLDVVPSQGQPWTTSPHLMTRQGNFWVGRGVFDDLGMAAIATEVFVFLKQSKAVLSRDVILALTGDEESGGLGIRDLIKNHWDLINSEVALNEGENPVFDENGKVKWVGIQVAEKTYQDFEVIATGTTGHSSVPTLPNAIYKLSEALTSIATFHPNPRLLPLTRAYFLARAAIETPAVSRAMHEVAESRDELPPTAVKQIIANPMHEALLQNTCVATLIQGGTKVNALPGQARASINCRILPDEAIEDVRKKLVSLVNDPNIVIRALEDNGVAGPSPERSPQMDQMRKVISKRWPGVPIVPTMSLGATDSRFLRLKGVHAYGLNPMPMLDNDQKRAHGIDERIPIDSLQTGFDFFKDLVMEIAGE